MEGGFVCFDAHQIYIKKLHGASKRKWECPVCRGSDRLVTQYWVMAVYTRHETNKFQQQNTDTKQKPHTCIERHDTMCARIRAIDAEVSNGQASYNQQRARSKLKWEWPLYNNDTRINNCKKWSFTSAPTTATASMTTALVQWGRRKTCIWLYCDILVSFMLDTARVAKNRKNFIFII